MTGRARAEQALIVAFVEGRPAPQGSKKHVGNGVMVEMSTALKQWRGDVAKTVRSAAGLRRFPAGTPVHVELEFVTRRPVSTPKRWTPPAVKRPDVDKLCRAVLDGISMSKVWADDSQVTHLCATKRVAEIGEDSGCHITIAAAQQPRGATNRPTVASVDPTTAAGRSGGDS